MKMYHSTPKENLKSILKYGLIRRKMSGGKRQTFVIYLAPTLESVNRAKGHVILEVETGNNKLTAFDDCREWEVLCWGDIPPENIKVIEVIK